MDLKRLHAEITMESLSLGYQKPFAMKMYGDSGLGLHHWGKLYAVQLS